MLSGFSVDHDGRGTLQDLLDRVVVEVGHDGRAQLFQNLFLEIQKTNLLVLHDLTLGIN